MKNSLQNLLYNKKFLVIIVVFIVIVFFALALLSSSKTKDDKLARSDVSTQVVVSPSAEISAELQIAIDEAKNSATEFDDWQTSLKTDYPWLRRLPLAGEKFFVYFDLNRGKFIGFLYLAPGDNITDIKVEIIKQLKDDKQIPVENYNFEWTISSQ